MWVNVVITGIYCQIPIDDMGESYMVILVRYNRKTLVYPDPDIILPFNNISNKTVKAINRTFWNNEVVTI